MVKFFLADSDKFISEVEQEINTFIISGAYIISDIKPVYIAGSLGQILFIVDYQDTNDPSYDSSTGICISL